MTPKIAVFFDGGGVLFDDMCLKMLIESIRQVHGDSFTQQDLQLLLQTKAHVWKKYETNNLSEQDFWSYILESTPALSHESVPSLIKKIRTSRMIPFYGTLSIAQDLRKDGHFVGIISNHSVDWFNFAWSKFELQLVFPKENVVTSFNLKTAKPNEKIFLHAKEIAANAGFPNPFFVDDKILNVEVANSLGFKGIHFDSRKDNHLALRQKLGMSLP